MLKIIESAGMQSIEREAMGVPGISGLALMENAGQALARAARSFWPDQRPGRVVVLAGNGKNGGDGLVCARALAQDGTLVRVVLLAGSAVAPETQEQRAALPRDVVLHQAVPGESSSWIEWFRGADVVVDALFGIGLSGPPRGLAADLIGALNHAGVPVLAADVPSGLNADTGLPWTEAVHAKRTLTFGLPKAGLLGPMAEEYVGQLVVETIGFPRHVLEARDGERQYVDREAARALLPWREPGAHKTKSGRVLIIGGSGRFHGAPLLAAAGAVRTGAGYVTLAYPEAIDLAMRAHTLEELCQPLPCKRAAGLGPECLAHVLSMASAQDIVLIGPGLDRDDSTVLLVREFVAQVKGPRAVVVDADALWALGSAAFVSRQDGPVLILTPHAGEAGRLLQQSAEEVQADRWQAASTLASHYQAVTVLKGRHTVVAAPGRPSHLVGAGSPALATAGTGDVLAGIVAALTAVLPDAQSAASLAVWLHGTAGEAACPDPGGLGLRARDVAEAVPGVMRSLRWREG